MPSSQELKSVIERIRSAPFPDEERAVEIKVILPLLSALGWDVQGDKVKPQYKVGGTRSLSKGSIDIALFGARGALCFIEAKDEGKRLEDHVNKLLEYAFHEGVVLCALTNGREWWLYLPRERGRPEARRFARLNLETDSFDEVTEQLQLFLAKHNLESGQAEAFGRQCLLDRREKDTWREMLEKPPKVLVETIADCIEQKSGTRPSGGRVAALLSATRFDASSVISEPQAAKLDFGEVETEQDSPEVSAATEVKPKATKRKKAPAKKIYGVRLWGDYKDVKYWWSAYVALANELYKRHPDEFFEKVRTLGGTKHIYFSYDEDRIGRPRPLEDSYPTIFANVHGSSSELVRMSKKLLKTFGYPRDDTNIWEIIAD